MNRLLWVILVLHVCLSAVGGDLILKREQLSSRRDAVGGIRAGDRFYFAGGFEYNDNVATDIIDVYNIKSGEWEEPLRLEEPRGFIASAVIGENIYFVGGAKRINCSMLYNTTLHSYEQIGCGPTVGTVIRVSRFNSIVTFLGSFSADFFNIASKEWYYIHELTSRMQEISNGITVTHENLIIGIGGINTTTLERLFDAWIFDTQTNETIVFSNVTTLNELSPVFKFSTGHGKIVIFTSDRYFVHQFGTTEWRESHMENATQAVILSDVIFIINASGFIIYDPSTRVETWTNQIISGVYAFENQVVLNTGVALRVYEVGVWTEILFAQPNLLAVRWFDNYLFQQDGYLLRLYNSQTKTVTQLTPILFNVYSMFAVNETIVAIFTTRGEFLTYDLETDSLSPSRALNMRGDFIIGSDIISLPYQAVLINLEQREVLYNTVGRPIMADGTVLTSNIYQVYQAIDVYNRVTRQWVKPSIQKIDMPISVNRFAQVIVVDELLIVWRSNRCFVYNTTAGPGGNLIFTTAALRYPSLTTVNRVPVVDRAGYLPTISAATIARVNSTSAEFIINQGQETSFQFVVSEDHVIYTSTFYEGKFSSIYTFDIRKNSLDVFKLPEAQKKLSIAYVGGGIIALGADGYFYGVLSDDLSNWYKTPFQHETIPTIIETLDDSTVMMTGGKHYQLGFYTDEVLFINASAVIDLGIPISTTPIAQNSTVGTLTEGELAAAIVVPVVTVIAGAIALIVVVVKRREKKKKSSSSNSLGLEARYGAWFTPFEQISFGEQLGQGGSGQVFKGTWKNTTVALKVSMTQANQSVIRELELMMQLRPHPNIVQLLGFSVHPETDSIILIIEFCEGGSLDNKLYDIDVEISLQTSVQWLTGIAKGLNHLHSNNVIHRDVAARNVLIHRNEPKLTDFGMSRIVDEQKRHGTTKSELGPIRWMSPESLKSKEYSVKSGKNRGRVICSMTL
jgi:hypothetical protein